MAKKKQTKQNQTPEVPPALRVARSVGWTLLTGLWLLVAVALLSYDAADPPGHMVAPLNEQPSNWVGVFGAVVAHHVYLMLGPGAWVALSGLATYLVLTAKRRPVSQPILRCIGLLLMTIAVSTLVTLGVAQRGDAGPAGWIAGSLPSSGRPEGAGGLIAIWLNDQLLPRFNALGTFVILTVGFWVGAVLAADTLVLALPRWCGQMLAKLRDIHWPKPVLVGSLARVHLWGKRSGDDEKTKTRSKPSRNKRRSKKAAAIDDENENEVEGDHIPEDAGGVGGTESFDPDDLDGSKKKRRRGKAAVVEEEEDEWVKEGAEDEWEYEDEEEDDGGDVGGSAKPQAAGDDEEWEYYDEDGNPIAADELDEYETEDDEEAEAEDEYEYEDEYEDEEETADAPGAYVEDKEPLTKDQLRDKMKQLTINFAPQAKKSAPPPREVDLTGYEFPGLDMLEEAEGDFTEEQEKFVREQAVVLESALREYRIDGEVVGIDTGPVITLYEVRLAPGTKVSRVNTVASDVARSLKAHNIRVVPNTAGKDTVGIEVPNQKKERVRLKELMTVEDERSNKARLPMFLGKDASGNPVIEDLAKMPHMLIAGTTGSGKSVCMNSIIMSFLYTKRPDELKMVLVDPKMVEMSLFKDIPHLMCPVVTEMSKAAAILEWAVTKMDERYELLAEAGVRDIASYNSLSWDDLKERFDPATEEEEAKIPKKLPYLVFIIDELADLMMTNKEVESFIVRIAQKARAVGLHLILATQRPQANVVTGLIKSNMPCRVAFKVASGMDSRIVLDQKGAELLLGQGDMLYLTPRSSKLVRAQGTLVDDMEVRHTVKFLKTVAAQSFEPQLVQIKGPGAMAEDDEERDPLFDDAVRVVLETQRGSVSLLQRRLAIGYSRSSRLIEQIAQAGIIGEYKGSQAREVNLTLEEWDAMKAAAEQDEAGVEVHGTIDEDAEAVYDEDETLDDDGEAVDEYEYEDDEEDADDAGDAEAEYSGGEDGEEWEYEDEEDNEDQAA